MSKEAIITLVAVGGLALVGLIAYDHYTKKTPYNPYNQTVIPTWGVGQANQSGQTTWLDVVDNHLTDLMGLF